MGIGHGNISLLPLFSTGAPSARAIPGARCAATWGPRRSISRSHSTIRRTRGDADNPVGLPQGNVLVVLKKEKNKHTHILKFKIKKEEVIIIHDFLFDQSLVRTLQSVLVLDVEI